jgi:hypothetical protein
VAQSYEYNVSRLLTASSKLDHDGTEEKHRELIDHMNEMDGHGWELVSGTEHVNLSGFDSGAFSQWTTLFWRRPRSG